MTWANRSISSAHEQALVFCADFAKVCKDSGDMFNYYRWRMVLQEHRPKKAAWPSSGVPNVAFSQRQHSLPLM